MFETLIQDVRHGLRMLVKNPAFSLVAIASIGVGVAVCAAMFSVADGMVWRPLPVPRPGEVVTINGTAPDDGGRGTGISIPGYRELRDAARSFTGVGAHRVVATSFARRREDQAISRLGFAVSANLLDVLEVRPELGRFFRPEEDLVAGRDAVVVISHDTWVQQFQADPGVVGQSLRLGGVPFTVIGVAPASFSGLELVLPGAYYLPLAMLPVIAQMPAVENALERRDFRQLTVRARLRPDVTLAQARAEVRQLGLALQEAHPDTEANRGLILRTHFEARQVERGPAVAIAAMVLTMAIVVLLVACANVAGLLTSRAPARAREIAVRLAMGAGRWRLVRQLITEAVLLAGAGGLAGMGLGYAAIRLLQRRVIISDIGVRIDFNADARVMMFAAALAAASALLAGLIPAWRAARVGDLSGTLRNGAEAGAPPMRLWGRHTLVAGQVALALMLVTVGVFIYRAFQEELRRGPGFQTTHLLLVNLDPTMARYDRPRAGRFFEQLKNQVRGISGVSSVALSSFMPMNQDYRENLPVVPEGFQFPPKVTTARVMVSRVDEGYFDVMRTRLVDGRAFLASDTADTPRVTIVNQTFAAQYWPGQEAVGKRLQLPGGIWAHVVGVAGDTKYNFITETPQPFVFLAARQEPATRTTLLVATPNDSAAVSGPIRAAVLALDREVPITGVWTMEQFYDGNAAGLSRLLTRVVGSIGLVGLGLAMVGLYGLMAYSVSRRTREIGIRMAVGAQPRSVLRMVMRHGLVLASTGIGAGMVLTFGVSGLMRSMFPSDQGIGFATYAMVVPALLAVTLLAALVPALRAARIDPLAALRQD